MHMDALMPYLMGAVFAIVAVGLLLRRFGQPVVVAYLVAGVVLGPDGVGLIEDVDLLERLGALGVLFLLFFVGMGISPVALLARWRVAFLGTGLQVLVSVGSVSLVGWQLGWSTARVVLLGFVISLSSTAVVLRLLQRGEGEEREVAGDVTAVLLAQDVLVVPMMVVIGLLHGGEVDLGTAGMQLVGGGAFLALLVWLSRHEDVRLPFGKLLRDDAELQVFASLLFCFGFAVLASSLQLSAALGAFVAGMIVGAARETEVFQRSLRPFEVVFVASFFVSVGMLIDLDFLVAHWPKVALLLGLVLVANTGLNACILRLLGSPWRRSLYAGSLLSQIGEFSFVLALVGYQAGIVGEFGYQATIAVISLSLAISPAWIAGVRRATREPRLFAPARR